MADVKNVPFLLQFNSFLNFHSSDDQLGVCTNLNLDHPFSYFKNFYSIYSAFK